MKNKFFLLSLLLFILISIISKGQSSFSTINPAFTEYIQNGAKLKISTDGKKLGKIPSPNIVCYSNKIKKSDIELPSSYDLRLVENGAYLSEVKNQGNSGTCWAFAAYGSIESYYLKTGLGEFDFSEQHMATCHGFDNEPDEGGNPNIAFSYLSRYSGAIDENDDPYTLPKNTECIGAIAPTGLISEIRWLPGKDSYTYNKQLQLLVKDSSTFDSDIIKNAIMTYGALDTDMLWDDFYFNSSDNTYFYNGAGSTDHEVLLVGWDDNKEITGSCIVKPKEKGAWIIRNSWGEDWGENGFFYISYEDTRALSEIAFYPSATVYDGQNTVFQYDEKGKCSFYGNQSETAYGVVKFTTEQDVQISAIGIYAATDSTILQSEIYNNFDGSTLSNQISNTVTTIAQYPGFYNLNFNNTITIEADNTFYVKIRCTTSGYNKPLAIEKYKNGFNSDVNIEQDKYWISDTGENGSWTQLGNDNKHMFDLCIKAYGKYLTNSQSSASESTAVNDKDVYSNIEIYPNPCYDYFTIRGNNLNNITINILSLSGQYIKSEETKNSSNKISVEDLPSGTYIIQLTKNNNILNQSKLIIL